MATSSDSVTFAIDSVLVTTRLQSTIRPRAATRLEPDIGCIGSLLCQARDLGGAHSNVKCSVALWDHQEAADCLLIGRSTPAGVIAR